MTVVIDCGAATDVGSCREVNEDAFVADPPLFAIADGMGGHAAGEVASVLALEAMSRLAEHSHVHSEDVLVAIDDANAAILERAQRQASARGMGSTLSGLCLGLVGDVPHWIVFNVGDSRVYLLANSRLVQLTTDHSEVAELVAEGRITADEARTHPHRNIITRSLGTSPAPIPDLRVLPFIPGDTYLVCSDGLTTEISDDDIFDILSSASSAQQAATELCERALLAGGRDNISVVVVRTPQHIASEVDHSTAPRLGTGGCEE